MALPSSREELLDFALRQLGSPVIEINLSADQKQDAVDLSLEIFQSEHCDGTELVFSKHEITANDVTNEYIPVDSSIIAVKRILPMFSNNIAGSGSFTGLKYQMALNNMDSWLTGDMSNYFISMTNINMVNDMMNGIQGIRFSRHSNRLYVDADWTTITAGEYIIIESYKILDPETYTAVYGDKFLIKYLTTLLKKNWGSVLKKFTSLQLPGGLDFSGQQIYDEAVQELLQLEEELKLKWSLPPEPLLLG